MFCRLGALTYDDDPARTVLDFFAQYRGGMMECGVFVWSTSSPASLIRVESGNFPPSVMQAENRDELLAALGCHIVPETRQ